MKHKPEYLCNAESAYSRALELENLMVHFCVWLVMLKRTMLTVTHADGREVGQFIILTWKGLKRDS